MVSCKFYSLIYVHPDFDLIGCLLVCNFERVAYDEMCSEVVGARATDLKYNVVVRVCEIASVSGGYVEW